MSFNKAIMQGNITRDPELRYTPGGQAVTTLCLAVNSKWGSGDDKKEETLFVDVNVWSKTAENCAKYLKKGSKVLVDGRLVSRGWDDKETGQKRSKMEITANTVVFLDSKRDADQGAQQPQDDDGVPF